MVTVRDIFWCPGCGTSGDLETDAPCPKCQRDAPVEGWPRDRLPETWFSDDALWTRAQDGERVSLRSDEVEVWVVDQSDAAPLRPLVAGGIGGLDALEALPDGRCAVRLARPALSITAFLEARARDGAPVTPAEAAGVGAAVVRALLAADVAGVEASALAPNHALLDFTTAPPRAVLPGIEAIDALRRTGGVGEPSSERSVGRWSAPDVADGRPWSAEDGVYTAGLVLYRMLAGKHPFSGLGLRERMRRQAAGEVPPLPDDVAERLPPGLQSAVLAMLEPRRAARPSHAEAIETLSAFAAGRLAQIETAPRPDRARSATPPAQGESAALPTAATPQAGPVAAPRGRVVMLGVLLGLVALLVVALVTAEPSDAPATAAGALPPGDAEPMTVFSTPEDCAHCHPNQVLEWERSVMAHAARSPLFNSLDMVIQEQFGRSNDCPNGAGALRKSDGRTACVEPNTGLPLTGTGGEHWCVNCHAPLERRLGGMAAWNGVGFDQTSRFPMPDQLSPTVAEGITCTFCHQVTGPATGRAPQDGYVGNLTWRSPFTGQVFDSRPERREGIEGIGNSGYYHDSEYMFDGQLHPDSPAKVHAMNDPAVAAYQGSSEFCGTCHDVRLFGTDAIGVAKGEHFKRLRNAYSEWVAWRDQRLAKGEEAASCQDCHMSLFPGFCDPNGSGGEPDGCPEGTGFVAVAPGAPATGGASTASDPRGARTVHYFSGVDVPMTPAFDARWSDDPTLDIAGIPLGTEQRRDLLLKNTFRLAIGEPGLPGEGVSFDGRTLTVPIVIENIGAGHRVPAGFSQEREVWLHVRVTDSTGRVVYEAGRVDSRDEDLKDKIFLRVNTDPDIVNANGQPIGLFGADVIDGPDVPRWFPRPELGGATRFRGQGLINFQNGFLRCVSCLGTVKLDGSCEAPRGLESPRAARFTDGEYDLDTGACISNLSGLDRFFEVWFPVGGLDATRGALKGPDAIIDTRSIPPETPMTYVHELNVAGFAPPFDVEATLNFRAFPPFLLRAFAEYERIQTARGRRPNGPLLTLDMIERLEVVALERAERRVE